MTMTQQHSADPLICSNLMKVVFGGRGRTVKAINQDIFTSVETSGSGYRQPWKPLPQASDILWPHLEWWELRVCWVSYTDLSNSHKDVR